MPEVAGQGESVDAAMRHERPIGFPCTVEIGLGRRAKRRRLLDVFVPARRDLVVVARRKVHELTRRYQSALTKYAQIAGANPHHSRPCTDCRLYAVAGIWESCNRGLSTQFSH